MELLEKLFSQTRVVLLSLDKLGNITLVNPAAEKLFGRPAEELVGQPFYSVLDPFSREKAEEMIRQTLNHGGVDSWELDHLTGENTIVLIGYSTSTLYGSQGEVLGLSLVGRDLTHELELTEKLAQTNQQLEGALLQLERTYAELKATQAQLVQSEKMRALGQLVAGVAHEVNNPSAFVASNLAHLHKLVPDLERLFLAYQPLRQNATAEQNAEIDRAGEAVEIDYLWQDLPNLVTESQDGIERIRQIVLTLRNFSRLDEAELKHVDLNQGLHSTIQLIRPLCRDRITIEETYAELRPVLCRPGELNQVFLNLLTNSVQAIEGEGHIYVTTRDDLNHVTVQIKDTGMGMDTVTMARLGEPFFTTKPVGAGMGLGLAISYKIIEQHKGKLTYHSQPGKGTVATLEIPYE